MRIMDDRPNCIFCERELGPETKPEHILLNALGGRKTTKRVICSDHNNQFGSFIDSSLAGEIEFLRNYLQLESGTGKPPPMLKNIDADGERINISGNGTPKLVTPPFTVTDLPSGKRNVEILAQTPDELRNLIPHLAACLRISEEDVIEKLARDGQFSLIERRPGRFYSHISFGTENSLRSIAKSCLVLFATVAGNTVVKSAPFNGVRSYILHGNSDFSKANIQIDTRDVPCTDQWVDRFGPNFNLIYVRSDEAGRVIGYFALYNVISWQVVLAESGAPAGLVAALVSNPIAPAIWEDDTSKLPDIPLAWLNDADRTYDLEHMRERLITMTQRQTSIAREKEIGRICDEVFTKNGFTDENQTITDLAALNAINEEINQRLSAHFLRLPHEQELSSGEIEAILRGKK